MDQKPVSNLPNPIDLLSRALVLYWEKLSILLPLGFIVFIVGLIQIFSLSSTSATLRIVSALITVVVAYVVYLALIRAISSPTSMHVGEVFISVEHYIISSILVSGLVILAVIGGTVLAIIPGIIVTIYLVFSLVAVVVDRYEGQEALAFSWHLVKGRWWAVLLRFVVANIAIALIVGLVTSLFWLMGIGEASPQAFFLPDPDFSISQLIISEAINNFFTVPVTLCFIYVFYEALKLTALEAKDGENQKIRWNIKTLAVIGVVVLIIGVFISSFVITKVLPAFIQVTHAPAAAFSIF